MCKNKKRRASIEICAKHESDVNTLKRREKNKKIGVLLVYKLIYTENIKNKKQGDKNYAFCRIAKQIK